MIVCHNCFADKELKSFVIASASSVGDCEVCGSSNVHLIELKELYDFLQELGACFKVVNQGVSLTTKIQEKWDLFTSDHIAEIILNFALPKFSNKDSNELSLVDYADDIVENYSYWETLKEELKWSRRFFVDIGKLEELGWDGFFNMQYKISHDTKLYRARVHHQSGQPAYPSNEMMPPPSDIAHGGRANPVGIPYLYLSDNPETVLYEVRAAYLDELSVGVFQLNNEGSDIRIVDFTVVPSLFNVGKIKETIKAQLLREMISTDLSKPMRRYDSEIEYIPTQFICEYIRVFTGADGIRFKSSLHPLGNNIVIFDKQFMNCKEVKLNTVSAIKIKADLIVGKTIDY
ncbi:MAG: RES family NAD+ phosphorylase [Bacteroidetes bacterium]|nr:RES family NAD+ phosphorylase [Bacteroidota bacterium]MBU1579506.1 RES family NAD+ phosphorylase [Bacteroidota bacterium]MBU2558847.1 RES family NAD+ phosphorylase [Bacteroidota bacterium]